MKDDDIDIETLIIFALVVRERSISNAAKKLGRTKQSVHRQIKNFEESLSTQLLQKVKRSIAPTKIGQRLYQHAERIMDEKKAISEFLKKPYHNSSQTIKLTAPPLLAEVFLGSVINEFCSSYDNVKFECLLSNDVFRLDENDIDIAIRIGKYRHEGLENYEVISLGEVSRVICASPEYIQKYGNPESVQDLKNHRILHFGSLNEYGRTNWNLAKSAEFKPVLSASSPRLILDAAIKGHGVALLPEMLCVNEFRRKKLVEVLPQSRVKNIPIFICVRKGLSDSSPLLEFIKKVQQKARKENSWIKE